MTPADRLLAALDLVEDVDRAGRPADSVVSAWLRNRRGLNDADRGAILAALDGVLRHRARLGWWLDRLGHPDTPRARLLAWRVLTAAETPALIARHLDKRWETALTEPEHSLLTHLQDQPLTHPDMPEDVRLEVPDWAKSPLRQHFGADYPAEMSALLAPPTLDLRVNPVRTTRDAMLRQLRNLGLRPEPTRLSPLGIRLPERLSLSRLTPLRTGDIEIQDEGSQLVALLLDARPGDRVADVCAGAGGKTLAIASQMQNKGHVAACDVSEGRLKRCAERVRKAGLHNVQTQLLSSETDRWIKRRKGSFDRVLVDAPCSGTGTWRRNPDARWRGPEAQGLDHLVALQGRILASAARLVKPGGRLVYATCSLLPAENAGQVTAFLAAHPAFRLIRVEEIAPHLADHAEAGCLSLTPARAGTDGFFAAVMQRAPEETGSKT